MDEESIKVSARPILILLSIFFLKNKTTSSMYISKSLNNTLFDQPYELAKSRVQTSKFFFKSEGRFSRYKPSIRKRPNFTENLLIFHRRYITFSGNFPSYMCASSIEEQQKLSITIK